MGALATCRLPAALLDPAAYPHRPASVELRETHISWVFLAGDRVYKVRKPVRFPFLDYGTLARRRAMCAEEMRLGRRFAPSIYCGVVSLVLRGRDGLRIALEPDPRAVEYAVQMRRFDEAATLRAWLERGTLEPSHLVAVGGALAGFHAASPAPARRGTPLEDVIAQTLASLTAAGAPPERVQALRRFCGAALAHCAGELAARAAAGLVRDGHGDLRAEHVLLGRRIEAVDALEFGPGLRAADVAYDLAFLVVDVARDDAALARALVRGYRAAGGDAGSDELLGLLCAVRALGRAKVELLRAAQLSGTAAPERHARALRLLTLAEGFARRPPGRSRVGSRDARLSPPVGEDALRPGVAGVRADPGGRLDVRQRAAGGRPAAAAAQPRAALHRDAPDVRAPARARRQERARADHPAARHQVR
jgi:uncharacterized protein